jgi:hypothetical protein
MRRVGRKAASATPSIGSQGMWASFWSSPTLQGEDRYVSQIELKPVVAGYTNSCIGGELGSPDGGRECVSRQCCNGVVRGEADESGEPKEREERDVEVGAGEVDRPVGGYREAPDRENVEEKTT